MYSHTLAMLLQKLRAPRLLLRSALLKEIMDEPKYDERESMMFMDVVLNASESRRCSDGRMRRGRRRDAATERGRREAHIVGAGET